MKKLGVFCFLYAFVFSTLNLQNFAAWYISEELGQLFLYLNLGLLIFSSTIFAKGKIFVSKTVNSWLPFYMAYYFFGIIACIQYDYFDYLIQSIAPFIYFITFIVFLGYPQNRSYLLRTMLVAFFIYCILLIVLYHIGYDVDTLGKPKWGIERAEGLFGDANNSALLSIICYILWSKFYHPKYKLKRIFALSLIVYSLFLTFSTTGYFVFALVFISLNHRIFAQKKMIIALPIVPLLLFGLVNLTTLAEPLNLKKIQMVKIQNIENLFSLNLKDVDSSGRMGLLENLLEKVYEHPFFGNGIGFGNELRGHNTIIGVWADAGIIALILFLFVLFTYLNNTLKPNTKEKYYLLALEITLFIYMLSLQTVINQPYLICLFVWMGFKIDFHHTKINQKDSNKNKSMLQPHAVKQPILDP
jgi:O-antigen ligase